MEEGGKTKCTSNDWPASNTLGHFALMDVRSNLKGIDWHVLLS